MTEAKNTIELKDSERQPCEVWTRVMGYHRPVQSFNIGKKGEVACNSPAFLLSASYAHNTQKGTIFIVPCSTQNYLTNSLTLAALPTLSLK